MTAAIEAALNTSMVQHYQRNQVEGAIAQTIGLESDKLIAEMRANIKRLLDTDRKPSQPENYVFHSGRLPETGNAKAFTDLDAFLLLIGVRLNRHHWPQKTVVDLLRQARPTLSSIHARILKLDPNWLFDPAAIALVPSSTYIPDNAWPMFLVVATDGDQPLSATNIPFKIAPPNEALIFGTAKAGRSATFLELTTPAHLLLKYLATIKPAKRGRS